MMRLYACFATSLEKGFQPFMLECLTHGSLCRVAHHSKCILHFAVTLVLTNWITSPRIVCYAGTLPVVWRKLSLIKVATSAQNFPKQVSGCITIKALHCG
jgi:hypothetical protein